jgi:hypothetical protein
MHHTSPLPAKVAGISFTKKQYRLQPLLFNGKWDETGGFQEGDEGKIWRIWVLLPTFAAEN